MNKIKTLTKESMLKNINGLSLGDKAYCGPYGTVTCVSKAVGSLRINDFNTAGNYRGMQIGFNRNSRRFSVSGSSKLHNGGGWTMQGLRKAICG